MLNFFKNIFRNKQKEENIVMESETNNSTQQTKKKFEVEIYDKVSVGEPPYDRIELQKVMMEKPVIIEATSKKDLDEFGEKLELCKQTFKIVRVIDEQPITKQTVSDVKPKQNIPLINNPVNVQPIVNSTIKEMNLIGNLANKSNYDYTKDDVDKIIKTLKKSVSDLESKFSSKNRSEFKL